MMPLFLLVRASLLCLSSYFASCSQKTHCSSANVKPPARAALTAADHCIKLKGHDTYVTERTGGGAEGGNPTYRIYDTFLGDLRETSEKVSGHSS